MKSYYFIFLVVIALTSYTEVSESLPTFNSALKTYSYPALLDSSLTLFFSDSTYWKCHYKAEKNSHYYPMSSFNLFFYDTCICVKENYLKSQSSPFTAPNYKLIESKILGYFIQKEGNQFEYSELNDLRVTTKRMTMTFIMDSILKTDTAFIENNEGNIVIEVTNYHKVLIDTIK